MTPEQDALLSKAYDSVRAAKLLVQNWVYFLILQICASHFDVVFVALTVTLPKNLKKHLTPISQSLYSCLHLSSAPTGPGL